MNEYIDIILTDKLPKTNIYMVYNNKNYATLGYIKWYGGFRKYCFFPQPDTIFETKCLHHIIAYINKLMEERKCLKKKN